MPMPDGGEMPATHRSIEVTGMEIAVGEGDGITRHDMVWTAWRC